MKVIHVNPKTYAIVDDADYQTLSGYDWYLDDGQVRRHETKTDDGSYRHIKISLARSVAEAAANGAVILGNVRHRDGDGCNNTRGNLIYRIAGRRRAARRSEYRGVSWHPRDKRWMARFAGKYLGSFPEELDAALAYDEAARDYYGAGAKRLEKVLNFPDVPSSVPAAVPAMPMPAPEVPAEEVAW